MTSPAGVGVAEARQHLTADESLVKGVCVILVIHWFAMRLRLRDCQSDTLYANKSATDYYAGDLQTGAA